VTGEEGKVGNRILSHGIQFSTIKRNEKWIEWRPHRLRLRALCLPISLFRFVDIPFSLESQIGNWDVLELDESAELLIVCNEEIDIACRIGRLYRSASC
jgi:hypothetical protein